MKMLLFLLIVFSLNCQTETQSLNLDDIEKSPELNRLIRDFTDSNWGTVYKAKDSLMTLNKEAIPHLLKLMEDEKQFSKLKNTADLIYPGATAFYGHGWFIPYDLDWIAIRAGWALEDLTFQNFGFKEHSITEKDLIELHKENYEEYIQTRKHDVDFQRESFKRLSVSIKNAKTWWIKNHNKWSNKEAIKEALYSDDIIRQCDVISHLRYPNYKTKGLTKKYYYEKLKPRIEELVNSDDECVSEEAKLRIDEEFYEK